MVKVTPHLHSNRRTLYTHQGEPRPVTPLQKLGGTQKPHNARRPSSWQPLGPVVRCSTPGCSRRRPPATAALRCVLRLGLQSLEQLVGVSGCSPAMLPLACCAYRTLCSAAGLHALTSPTRQSHLASQPARLVVYPHAAVLGAPLLNLSLTARQGVRS